MMIKTFLSALFILICVHAKADCFDRIQSNVNAVFNQQKEEYLKTDPKYGQVLPENYPVLHRGRTSKAVLIQHGFMASPFEVQIVGNALAEAGYTVYMPLLAGFGSSAKVANKYTKEHWKNYFKTNVQILEQCYDDITLIGFSTGGTLTYDYVTTYPEDKKIKAEVLISPFFQMHMDLKKYILNISKKVETVSMRLIPTTLISDFLAIKIHSQNYNSAIPLKAAYEVIALGDEVHSKILKRKVQVPSLVIYSDADKTISQTEIKEVIVYDLEKPEVLVLPASYKIPHQILVSSVSSQAKAVTAKIQEFVLRFLMAQ